MAAHVDEGDVIWSWAARRFAGEEHGERIWWDLSLPVSAASADHRRSDTDSHAYIRIRPTVRTSWGEEVPGDFARLWAGAVFELHNICNSERFNRIDQDAFLGELTKGEYVDGYTRLEYDAVRRTVDFYNRVWAPWARSKDLDPEDFLADVSFEPTYDKWAAQYANSMSGYPEVPFGRYYDTVIVPYLLRTGRFPQARWLCGSVRTDPGGCHGARPCCLF